MGLFSGITKGVVGGLLGGSTGALAGIFGGNFLSPGVEGMSEAERRALEEQQRTEGERRRRLLESQQRRTRIALGAIGGARSLLYGGGPRAEAPTVDAPAAVAAPRAPRTLMEGWAASRIKPPVVL